ncbi:hypothetical protein COLU111180_12120 [Cohnella lubricantis]|uniref:Uncharacterized protein n=1 Tax=Cohnella lubricantis TaxID=2163172 RepID=A0A841T3P6_9BACL|nr:hypothetical protein [Cohnella lubricantis]MBB6675954.1 hypothetical protein [Cohnella lubricantis]MBP2117929.1 hypothetical protein [Cohnella lubricantis]
MSQPKEITVGFTFTKNLGNYESLKVDAGVVMTVEPSDDPDAVYAKAWESAKKQIKRGLEAAKGGF